MTPQTAFLFGAGTGGPLRMPLIGGKPALITRTQFEDCCCHFDPADYFQGYVDPNTYFARFTIYDWDTNYFGPNALMEGVAWLVDGHVTYEAIGGGMARIVESTGNYATEAGYTVGREMAVSAVPQFMFGPLVSNTMRRSWYEHWVFGELTNKRPGSPVP